MSAALALESMSFSLRDLRRGEGAVAQGRRRNLTPRQRAVLRAARSLSESVFARVVRSMPTDEEFTQIAMDFLQAILRALPVLRDNGVVGDLLSGEAEARISKRAERLREWFGPSSAGVSASESVEAVLRIILVVLRLPFVAESVIEEVEQTEFSAAELPPAGVRFLRAEVSAFVLLDAADEDIEVPHREELAHRAYLDAVSAARELGFDPFPRETPKARRARAKNALLRLGTDLAPEEHAAIFHGAPPGAEASG